MSNVFNKTGVTYFQLPQAVIPLLSKMRPSTLSMYVFLCHEAQRNSRPALILTNSEFQAKAQLSPNSVHDARVQLEELRLIHCERASHPGVRRVSELIWQQRRRGHR